MQLLGLTAFQTGTLLRINKHLLVFGVMDKRKNVTCFSIGGSLFGDSVMYCRFRLPVHLNRDYRREDLPTPSFQAVLKRKCRGSSEQRRITIQWERIEKIVPV